MLIFANSFSEERDISQASRLLGFSRRWRGTDAAVSSEHSPGMEAEAESQILSLIHPADGEASSPVMSWHPRAPREHPVGGLLSRAGQRFFSELRGVFLLKTRLSGGLELFENSGQMQQGVLVETKEGRFEKGCQNIFSLSFFPPVTK